MSFNYFEDAKMKCNKQANNSTKLNKNGKNGISLLNPATSYEVLKREKRREQNKLAAARCRQKRNDQILNLSMEVAELQKTFNSLSNDLKQLLKNFYYYKNCLDHHSHNCKLNQFDLFLSQIYSEINFADMNAALEPILDDDLVDTELKKFNAATLMHKLSTNSRMADQTEPPVQSNYPPMIIQPVIAPIQETYIPNYHSTDENLLNNYQSPNELHSNISLQTPYNWNNPNYLYQPANLFSLTPITSYNIPSFTTNNFSNSF